VTSIDSIPVKGGSKTISLSSKAIINIIDAGSTGRIIRYLWNKTQVKTYISSDSLATLNGRIQVGYGADVSIISIDGTTLATAQGAILMERNVKNMIDNGDSTTTVVYNNVGVDLTTYVVNNTYSAMKAFFIPAGVGGGDILAD